MINSLDSQFNFCVTEESDKSHFRFSMRLLATLALPLLAMAAPQCPYEQYNLEPLMLQNKILVADESCSSLGQVCIVDKAIQANVLTDVTYLPPSVTFLNMYSNEITQIVNHNWAHLTFLRLGLNPLKTIANVRLSRKLEFFGCEACPLANITVDPETYDALNALERSDGEEDSYGFFMTTNVSTDAAACNALGGAIRPLWAGKTNVSVTACVTSPTASSSKWTIVGASVGGVAFLLIIVGYVLYRSKRRTAPDNTMYASSVGRTMGTADSDGLFDLSRLRQHRLELAELRVTSSKPLAKGAFGEVWLGTYGPDVVAIKRLLTRDADNVQRFIDEIALMAEIDCPFIVSFVGASWRRPVEIECVVEYMNLGDLRSYLSAHGPDKFDWNTKLQCMVSITKGLTYLHTCDVPIVHRDLKSRNVLLDSVKGTKLTDFGVSRAVSDTLTNGIGTFQWMAPEVIVGTAYSVAADIYSFGIVLSEFSTHRLPYADLVHPKHGRPLTQQYIMTQVAQGLLQPTFQAVGVPAWVHELALQCLHVNPAERPSAPQLTAMLNKLKNI
ncbi:protein kinase [Achlya hypogyna]|uniref:Protein kinase n=1 Tax=Achlya hypogyna TaxID=1202772 RepID=A0A1V9ZNK5_ACHHY|nr:protein kinase [Achlya hypogyna]